MYLDKKAANDDLNEFKDMDGIQLNKLLINRLEIIESNFADARIFIFIDSIDQLNSKDLNLNWFLKEYLLNAKVVFSTLTNYFDIIEKIKNKGIEENFFFKLM